MSVIVSRALPDVRDGLKPVHRRILYLDERAGPHARPRLREVRPRGRRRDGQVPPARRPGDLRHPGAHGPAVLDGPAADRRPGQLRLGRQRSAGRHALHRVPPDQGGRWRILADLDTDTVDFKDNYDGKEREPVVLPSRIPNLLVNGAGGIAVGMATNIPPHNLGEVVDACLAMIDDPDGRRRRAAGHRAGPGLPDRRRDHRPHRRAPGAADRPRLGDRARHRRPSRRSRKDREAIIITAIPYQVNKAAHGRADRRTGAREAHRGHRRPARRERPPGHARGGRAEARRHAPRWC